MANFTPQIYSINNTNIIVADVTGSGLAGEKPYETERTAPEEFKLKIGAKGEGTFVYQPDKSGKFMVRVKQNEVDFNKHLHSLKDAGSIFEVLLVGSNALEEKAKGSFCMIGKAPRIVFSSADEEELEWEIVATELVETRK